MSLWAALLHDYKSNMVASVINHLLPEISLSQTMYSIDKEEEDESFSSCTMISGRILRI